MTSTARSTNGAKKSTQKLSAAESDDITAKWTILCIVIVVVCGGFGMFLQRVAADGQAKVLAGCKKNPQFSPQCEELLFDRSAPRIRADDIRPAGSYRAPFQLSGPDEDLTPPPMNDIFHR